MEVILYLKYLYLDNVSRYFIIIKESFIKLEYISEALFESLFFIVFWEEIYVLNKLLIFKNELITKQISPNKNNYIIISNSNSKQ